MELLAIGLGLPGQIGQFGVGEIGAVAELLGQFIQSTFKAGFVHRNLLRKDRRSSSAGAARFVPRGTWASKREILRLGTRSYVTSLASTGEGPPNAIFAFGEPEESFAYRSTIIARGPRKGSPSRSFPVGDPGPNHIAYYNRMGEANKDHPRQLQGGRGEKSFAPAEWVWILPTVGTAQNLSPVETQDLASLPTGTGEKFFAPMLWHSHTELLP